MLKSLRIQNIALIPEAEIRFGERLNVLTGETGAGKSIIVGSFNFVLGEKLSKNAIRQGASFARAEAVFETERETLERITELSGIEFEDGTAILARTLKLDGKSECRINGSIVTQQILKDAAALLINIHGQHETEVLLKPKNHTAIVDGFGGAEITEVLNSYNEEFNKLRMFEKSLETFGGSDVERARLADMYEFQVSEIEKASLREGEDEELANERQRMMNFEKINNALTGAVQVFNADEGGLLDGLRQVTSSVSGVSHLDGEIEKIYELAKAVRLDVQDVCDSLQQYLDSLEFNEDELRRVDERLDVIKSLKRKYGTTVSDVLAFLEETRAKLDALTRSEQDIERIKNQIAEQTQAVCRAAERLNKARQTAAVKMQREIVLQLKDLGMPATEFRAEFSGKETEVQDIEFMFSANKGEPVKPLASIISGGEMSRFMLALKTVTADADKVATLVFDEIDTGISGTMGLAIASKMAVLSKTHQVIAVTHLPQIAAMADTHFIIKKDDSGDRTLTGVTKADGQGGIAEIARMIGGAAAEASALEHAKAMKTWANNLKG